MVSFSPNRRMSSSVLLQDAASLKKKKGPLILHHSAKPTSLLCLVPPRHVHMCTDVTLSIVARGNLLRCWLSCGITARLLRGATTSTSCGGVDEDGGRRSFKTAMSKIAGGASETRKMNNRLLFGALNLFKL